MRKKMRNMSFMLTTAQIRAGTKTVTRRLGWKFLKPGDRLMACVKCQGLGKGGKIEKIREIEVVSVRQELVMPPVTTLDEAHKFGVFMLKAVMDGRGSELIDLAKTNLVR